MRRIRIAATFVALVVAVVLTGCGANTDLFGPQDAVVEPAAAESTTSDSPASSAACEPQYTQAKGNHADNRVIGDFAKRYAKATADAHNVSKAQRSLLLKESGKDAQVLAIWTHAYGLHEDPNKWKPLVADGCLSSEGIKLHAMFEGVLSAKGTKFKEANAPASGYNSGVKNGVFGVSNSSGIRGDRTAIKVTLPDGSVVYIMVRCANVVYPGKPGLPVVPTDNPPPPKPKPQPKPQPPTYNPPDRPPPYNPPPVSKKIPSQDPYPQGNAPTGGGKNYDPGPGKYVPPKKMDPPPDKPRENPAPPAPKPPKQKPPTPSNPNPDPVPTKDPAPPPPRETEAPKPSKPEDGCIVIPGVEDCK